LPSKISSQPTNGRPRIFYVSYDGIAEPLGRSQVLAYLRRLAGRHQITLISFEKTSPSDALRRELATLGVDWRPLRYHRRPPVLATAIDVFAGRRALTSAAREGEPAILHVRSYVPALIALLARPRTGGKLLFDIRGFWADERVEGGLWRAGGLLYRIAKRCERWFFAEADAVVTLTEASVPQIRTWTGAPVDVIPTCVELEHFTGRTPRPDGPHAVWCGSIGTWYRFDLAPAVAAALSLPLTVITRQKELAREQLGDFRAEVYSAAPEAIPATLFEGDIGLCLIVSSFSKIASAPTRFAEYLAAGMPVLVTPGVGDLEQLVEGTGVGVVLRGEDRRSVRAAADAMLALTRDPGTSERCRQVARERLDVESGSARYAAIYGRLIAGATRGRPR
jgi:glycosyltransferase involved in cell wall biosynthesis